MIRKASQRVPAIVLNWAHPDGHSESQRCLTAVRGQSSIGTNRWRGNHWDKFVLAFLSLGRNNEIKKEDVENESFSAL